MDVRGGYKYEAVFRNGQVTLIVAATWMDAACYAQELAVQRATTVHEVVNHTRSVK